MFFFASASAHLADLVDREAREAGAVNIQYTGGGITFEGDLRTAYSFCMNSRVSTRLMMAIYRDDDVQTVDELYEASLLIPWEDWITPELTFALSESVGDCSWINNSHFAALKVKDAIVDKVRQEYDGERPSVDKDNPDVGFHLSVSENTVIWYVDFSGRSMHHRGYREERTKAALGEHIAAAVLYRSDWHKTLDSPQGPSPLLDPFCGSGTIGIEAALMAAHIAPGLISPLRFSFYDLPVHDPKLWDEIIKEAESKKITTANFTIIGWDYDERAVELARKNAELAGVSEFTTWAVQDITKIEEAEVASLPGYIVTDPPYGIRLSMDLGRIETLYTDLGHQLSQLFGGWNVAVLCGEQELLSYMDLKPNRTNSIISGGITCQLAHYYVFTKEERQAMMERALQKKQERLAQPLTPGAQMAANRLKKNLTTLIPLMKKQEVSSYRIYDADMPEYSAAIDFYEHKWISLQEYAPPESIEMETSQRRLEELIDATERVTGIDREFIFVKQRARQRGITQYERLGSMNRFVIMREHGLMFLLNFTDYLDVGIFLDHRPVRAMIQSMSKDKRFLNLFCYTGTATVHAASGGALSTVSVDASSTYLDWAMKNMEMNGFSDMNHFYYKDDCIDWLFATYDKYDLIFCDPPTFSNSKSRKTFNVSKDHYKLIKACMMHLDYDGTLIFSTNFRKFTMDERLEEEYQIENITAQTIGDDFSRDQKIHYCWLIKHKKVIPLKKIPQKRFIKKQQ